MASRPLSHQLLVLAVALALIAGLFVLPKVMVKPKEGKGELNQDAARTANRDGGGPATSGSKALASSGEQEQTADPMAGTPEQPHQQATPEQSREIKQLAARYSKERDPQARLRVASDLAAKYKAIAKFDSAGYYYEQVAVARPGEQAWKRAADEYFEAFGFAATEERAKTLSAKTRELYEKVLKNNPDNLDAKTNLGMAYMASDNPVQGVTLLREVLATNPRNEKALYNLGILSIQSNQYDKAVERFRELVKVNPNNINGQFYLGVSLAQTGAKEEARAAFIKAKSLSSDPSLAASVDEELSKLE
ncbi:tetratricopeptide repeat protein [Hymenobacter sp. HD11105]